jgi:alkylhydroperoxidase/carboxymuconolactone decarboxylase family protein YurZ
MIREKNINKTGRQQMNEKERTLIAMGAAMGSGCKKCAEGLLDSGKSLKIPAKEIWKAFEMGLNAKAEAVNTMRAAASSMLHKEAGKDTECGCAKPDDAETKKDGRMACLIRLASYAASNSAPDVLSEIDEAVAEGANRREIRLCMSIAKMVREKAAGFCDQEVGQTHGKHKSDEQQLHDKEATDAGNAGCSCGCK